ncbi:hypothetical protein E4S40_09580 [Algoriphagus kandeliae]|uniref:Uncharacterized protein n=1 Tax=Algoriphagus kandeliae TaxID=2562278 RepID=A0A4Y9QSY2_9BACT|nr:hypothetical protein [Algoriphagus kandeliae]TFV94276.1 hypothetical protein E4S40_09580 [Algoriphagus kandeliae]
MKTSNKIVYSFLAFAWLSIMVTLVISFFFSRLRGFSTLDKVEVKEWPVLGSYSVVSIQDSWVVSIERQKEGTIQYTKYYFSREREELLEDPDPFFYEVRNDTLFVKGMKQKPTGKFSIHVGPIKSIVLKDVTEVRVKEVGIDSLIVKANHGHLTMEENHGVGFLRFEGKNESRLQIMKIPALELYLDQSKAEIYKEMGDVSGNLARRSEVILPTKLGELNLTKDENSKVSIEEY